MTTRVLSSWSTRCALFAAVMWSVPLSSQSASQQRTAGLRGQVVDPVGNPIGGAILETDHPFASTIADDSGYFRFAPLPAGAITVHVRRLPFSGIKFDLLLLADSTVSIGVTLKPQRQQLSTFTIETQRVLDARKAELNSIRRMDFGFTIDSAQIAHAANVQRALTFPDVAVKGNPPQWYLMVKPGVAGAPWDASVQRKTKDGGDEWCAPTIWIDGTTADIDSLRAMPKNDIALITVFPAAADAPRQYTRTRSNCGVVLAWRKTFINP